MGFSLGQAAAVHIHEVCKVMCMCTHNEIYKTNWKSCGPRFWVSPASFDPLARSLIHWSLRKHAVLWSYDASLTRLANRRRPALFSLRFNFFVAAGVVATVLDLSFRGTPVSMLVAHDSESLCVVVVSQKNVACCTFRNSVEDLPSQL